MCPVGEVVDGNGTRPDGDVSGQTDCRRTRRRPKLRRGRPHTPNHINLVTKCRQPSIRRCGRRSDTATCSIPAVVGVTPLQTLHSTRVRLAIIREGHFLLGEGPYLPTQVQVVPDSSREQRREGGERRRVEGKEEREEDDREQSVVNGDLSPRVLRCPARWNLSNISSLLEGLQCDDEGILVDTLRTLQKVASGCCSCMESLCFEPEIVHSLFLQHEDLIKSTFMKIGKSSPPSAVLLALARISLFPHLRIASISVYTLYCVVKRSPSAITLLPSPIFPSSSSYLQYSGVSFLDALTMKLRIVFSEFQTNLPTDLSHLPKYVQITKDDPFVVTRSIRFCDHSCDIPFFILDADSPIEVHSEIIRELILFVKEALPTILTNISTIDTLIASLPSDSSLTTPLGSGVNYQIIDSLKQLRNQCEVFVRNRWMCFVDLTCIIADPHKSSFQTIILDDPSFPDLILNCLKLNHKDVRLNILISITNIVIDFPSMKEPFLTANLVELVEYEMRTMIEMKAEEYFKRVFRSMLNRTSEWNRDKRERQKRREVVLREEGWDDAFELRVVGIEVDTIQNIQDYAKTFRAQQAFNSDRL
ncbi:hypothetical protein BLNAU_3974 [Blattamonas nauphoetae]|uniref:Uncharacterized protein n=1 Tax=Blattamonas nauphoetae TaxID=2049346 RepID=A0ABQ9YC19_9EUKA|nr:hypothetical protein BLNAU_3974 [Blattamonas nauphoetae]